MATTLEKEENSDDDGNSVNPKASLRLDLKRILDWDKVQYSTKPKGQFPCTGCSVVLCSVTEQRGHRRDCIGYSLVKAGLQDPVAPDYGAPRDENYRLAHSKLIEENLSRVNKRRLSASESGEAAGSTESSSDESKKPNTNPSPALQRRYIRSPQQPEKHEKHEKQEIMPTKVLPNSFQKSQKNHQKKKIMIMKFLRKV